MVNEDKVPPPNSKTYSQKDVDHLLEQSRLQDITDKKEILKHTFAINTHLQWNI